MAVLLGHEWKRTGNITAEGALPFFGFFGLRRGFAFFLDCGAFPPLCFDSFSTEMQENKGDFSPNATTEEKE
jgi:hypothetical protein